MTSISGWNKINRYVPAERPCPNLREYMIHSVKLMIYLEVYRLANIKSAKKRILVNETKAARNKAIRSKVKTAVKKVDAAIAQNDAEAAKTALRAAIVEITKAGSKGVYHKKTVSRKISRLSKAVNSIA